MRHLPKAALATAAVLLAVASFDGSAQATTLKDIVEQPVSPQFGLHDSAGHTMDTLKAINTGVTDPKYVGVYHYGCVSSCTVAVATSDDLTSWTYQHDLAPDPSDQPASASQPTVARYGGGYAVADESNAPECQPGSTGKSCIEVRRYGDLSSLLTGTGDPVRHTFIPRMLSSCNEGTPDFMSAPTNEQLVVGFHYNSDCAIGLDREAYGTLQDWGTANTWVPITDGNIDSLLTGAGAPGKHGDRDRMVFAGGDGKAYTIYEAQKVQGDNSTWEPFLYDGASMMQLNVQSGCGATGFANSTFSSVTLPDGTAGIFVTHFIFNSARGACPGGEMSYFAPPNPPSPASPSGGTAQKSSPAATSPPPAAADKLTAFSSLLVRSRQKIGKLYVEAAMGEAGTISARGHVKISGQSGSYGLRTTFAPAVPGARVRLRPKLSQKSFAAVRKALKRHRKAIAKITIAATDLGGNVKQEQRTVRLRP